MKHLGQHPMEKEYHGLIFKFNALFCIEEIKDSEIFTVFSIQLSEILYLWPIYLKHLIFQWGAPSTNEYTSVFTLISCLT